MQTKGCLGVKRSVECEVNFLTIGSLDFCKNDKLRVTRQEGFKSEQKGCALAPDLQEEGRESRWPEQQSGFPVWC